MSEAALTFLRTFQLIRLIRYMGLFMIIMRRWERANGVKMPCTLIGQRISGPIVPAAREAVLPTLLPGALPPAVVLPAMLPLAAPPLTPSRKQSQQ